MPIKDLINQKFGKLTVVEYAGADKNGRATWLCKCVCGKEKIAKNKNLAKGSTKSCGCLKKGRPTTHGCSEARIYKIWTCMIQRCTNSNAPTYYRYGGRGITVCKRWHKFNNFLKDMKKPPTSKYQIDRVDNDKGYFKTNCRWATRQQQQRNRRSNRLITFQKRTQCLAAWASDLKINYNTLCSRLYTLNWPTERALTTPVKKTK